MFSTCAFCGDPCDRRGICAPCIELLPVNDVHCERCGRPLAAAQPDGVPCADCQLRPPPYRKARAPYVYEFPLDAAIKAMKFRRQLFFLPPLAALLEATLAAEFGDCDLLVPVPLHRYRHALRGYNQARELARELAKRAALPVFDGVRRVRATRPQAGLSRLRRRRNLANAFAPGLPLPGRHPLIVDDVITTGATAEQLAAVLVSSGADAVSVLAVAAARDGTNVAQGVVNV